MFCAAHNFNLVLLPGAHLAERVGVVVDVAYVAAGKFDDAVARKESGFGGRRIVAHAAEFQAVARVRVVRDRAELDAEVWGASLRVIPFPLRVGRSFTARRERAW